MTTIWLTTIYTTSMMRMTHPRGEGSFVDTKIKSGDGDDDDDGVLLLRLFFDPLHMNGNGAIYVTTAIWLLVSNTRLRIFLSKFHAMLFLSFFLSHSLFLSFVCLKFFLSFLCLLPLFPCPRLEAWGRLAMPCSTHVSLARVFFFPFVVQVITY